MNKSDKDFLLYVISGNYNEFVGYALAHSLPPHKLVYVDDPRKLRGVRVENYVYVGTYYKICWHAPIKMQCLKKSLILINGGKKNSMI